VLLLDLEMELQTLLQAVDITIGYVCARGERLKECLLDIPERIRDVVEYGIHRGAGVALVEAQVWWGHELYFLVGILKGEGAADHERLVEDFDEAADAVATEVPAGEVIPKAL
jgi:hypothetical protein